MTDDDRIKTLMANAAMLMEDASADMLLDPLPASRTDQLRDIASDLLRIADHVDAIRRGNGS